MRDSSLKFLHQLNDGGLLFLNHYLEERCECSVFHISPSNRLIYDGKDVERVRELKKKICASGADRQFVYDGEERCMVYQYSVNEYKNRFVFFPVEEQQCLPILDEINEVILPVGYFLKGLYVSFGQYKSLLENDIAKILQPEKDYWCNILNSRMIDPDAEMTLLLIDPGEGRERMNEITRYVTNLSVRDGGADVLSYVYRGRLLLLIPGRFKVRTAAEMKSKDRLRYPVDLHLDALKEQFGGEFHFCISNRVHYCEIYQAYIQALSTRFYMEYFRREEAIIRFRNIGPASNILQHNIADLEIQLEEKYEGLSCFESERNGYLLTTLRELVRCQFNYQDAAQRLHVHLNTLYYRQDKIGQVLNMDLTTLEAKIVLYHEIFAYDFLEFMNHDVLRH